MSNDEVDMMSKLQAERLMGQAITADELQRTVASLVLQLDKLARAFGQFSAQLWTEDKLRTIIGDEMGKRCRILHANEKLDTVTSKWFSLGGKPASIVALFLGVAILVMGILYVMGV